MVAVDESPAERGAPAEIAVECIVPNPHQPRQSSPSSSKRPDLAGMN